MYLCHFCDFQLKTRARQVCLVLISEQRHLKKKLNCDFDLPCYCRSPHHWYKRVLQTGQCGEGNPRCSYQTRGQGWGRQWRGNVCCIPNITHWLAGLNILAPKASIFTVWTFLLMLHKHLCETFNMQTFYINSMILLSRCKYTQRGNLCQSQIFQILNQNAKISAQKIPLYFEARFCARLEIIYWNVWSQTNLFIFPLVNLGVHARSPRVYGIPE